MKQLHIKMIFITLFLLEGFLCEKSTLSFSNKQDKGTATLSIALILKGLGTNRSKGKLTNDIKKKCLNKDLMKKWLKLLKRYKDILMMTNKYNLQEKYLEKNLHTERILFIRSFLKTIWSCGQNNYTKKAIKKVENAYFGTINSTRNKVFNFVRILKYLFLKKSNGKTSIYPLRLNKQINIVKDMIDRCNFLVKKRCGKKVSNRCNRLKISICRRGIRKRKDLRKIIRVIFAKYLSKAFINYITSFKTPKI